MKPHRIALPQAQVHGLAGAKRRLHKQHLHVALQAPEEPLVRRGLGHEQLAEPLLGEGACQRDAGGALLLQGARRAHG